MIIRGLLPGAHAAAVIAGPNLPAACSVGRAANSAPNRRTDRSKITAEKPTLVPHDIFLPTLSPLLRLFRLRGRRCRFYRRGRRGAFENAAQNSWRQHRERVRAEFGLVEIAAHAVGYAEQSFTLLRDEHVSQNRNDSEDAVDAIHRRHRPLK